jgi:hypothetical protein
MWCLAIQINPHREQVGPEEAQAAAFAGRREACVREKEKSLTNATERQVLLSRHGGFFRFSPARKRQMTLPSGSFKNASRQSQG